MRRLEGVVACAATAALLLASAATPAGGATARHGELVIVNGMPGTRVNVCINGQVAMWALPYGARIVRRVAAGSTGVRVFPAASRSCVGQHIAGRRFWLRKGGNKTIVATRREPRLVLFDNSGLLPPDAVEGDPLVVRHAADVGLAGFVVDVDGAAAGEELLDKREQLVIGIPAGPGEQVARLEVERSSGRAVAGPVVRDLRPGFRTELILVGTNRLNARIVTVRRPSEP